MNKADLIRFLDGPGAALTDEAEVIVTIVPEVGSPVELPTTDIRLDPRDGVARIALEA